MIRPVPYLGIGNPIKMIRSGESLSFSFDRGGETITGWECTINVVQEMGGTLLVDRTISPDQCSKWTGEVKSTETATMASPETYRLVATIANDATNEQETVVTRFRVTDNWV